MKRVLPCAALIGLLIGASGLLMCIEPRKEGRWWHRPYAFCEWVGDSVVSGVVNNCGKIGLSFAALLLVAMGFKFKGIADRLLQVIRRHSGGPKHGRV